MNRTQAEHKAYELGSKEKDPAVQYEAKHSAIESAWYVAKVRNTKQVGRFYV